MKSIVRFCGLISALATSFLLPGCGSSGGQGGTTTTAPVTYSERGLYSFGQAPDGSHPDSSMVFDALGNLYGTTSQGGTYGAGTVFKLSPNNGQWIESVLYSFCQLGQECPDGAQPLSNLILDSAGNLYGTASQGGAYAGTTASGAGIGVVFELTPQQDGTWTETVLHSFGNGTDGKAPKGGLAFGTAGNLYGTTYQGGTGPQCEVGCGTVFELSPGADGQWTEKVLYNFCSQIGCTDGQNPTSGVIVDDAGNLYGTTPLGGSPQDGIVFELKPGANSQWTESVLYEFQGGDTDGSSPIGTLAQDASRNLYGTTQSGYYSGGLNNGTVFKLTPGTGNQWSESILYGFGAQPNAADGSVPVSGAVLDGTGNLYGTTIDGGAMGWGVVFKLTPKNDGSWVESTLYSMQGFASGYSPVGLTLDSSGNLYGVAGGGTDGNGIVFELTAETAGASSEHPALR